MGVDSAESFSTRRTLTGTRQQTYPGPQPGLRVAVCLLGLIGGCSDNHFASRVWHCAGRVTGDLLTTQRGAESRRRDWVAEYLRHSKILGDYANLVFVARVIWAFRPLSGRGRPQGRRGRKGSPAALNDCPPRLTSESNEQCDYAGDVGPSTRKGARDPCSFCKSSHFFQPATSSNRPRRWGSLKPQFK